MNAKTDSSTQTSPPPDRAMIMVAVVLTAAVLLASSFFPRSRVWGLSVWAYMDVWVRFLFAFGLIGTAGFILWSRQANQDTRRRRKAKVEAGPAPLVVLLLAVVTGVIFYGLRTEVHFLGDGWLLLESLASENPLLRYRNFGEMLVHIWIRDALPLSRDVAALTSFRIVSVGAGVLHAVLVAMLAPTIIGNARQGWLFAFGMISGGYALLHFGYVENYSLFGLAVAAYVYLGVLISMQRIGRWWIVPAFLSTIFFHALGLALLPVTLFVLVSGTSISRRLSAMGGWARSLLIAATALAVVGGLYVALDRSLFLRFALVPLRGDPMVLDGYSMFSLSHIADMANLLMLLVPSLLVAGVALMRAGLRGAIRDPRMRFLGVATITVFIAVFMFEAKIGMPRDWDLFSFVGYPLSALSLIALLSVPAKAHGNRLVLVAIAIALFCLVPRVVTAHRPEFGIRQFQDYAEIDVRKNSSGMFVLQKYYRERGDSRTNDIRLWSQQRYPEESLYQKALGAFQQSDFSSALRFANEALALNPRMAAVWSLAGGIHTRQGAYESAVEAMEICNALNPDDSRMLTNLGRSYAQVERYAEAEHAFLKALALDSTYYVPIPELFQLYEKRNEHEKHMFWLEKAVYLEGAKGTWATALGEEYLKSRDFNSAARAFKRALLQGADSARISGLILTHPELASLMER